MRLESFSDIDNSDYFCYETVEEGIEKYTINLDTLYQMNTIGRSKFETKWPSFLNSDNSNENVIWREDNSILYLSESVLPEHNYERPPLLFVFGNPAPHSVKARIPFAYEGNGSEHRMWRVLEQTNLVKFHSIPMGNPLEKSRQRRDQLFHRQYDSQYTIGFIQYFSMPTTPSILPWTGVSGLFKLFGKKSMAKIETAELARIKSQVTQFMSKGGTFLIFQKDAYNGLREKTTMPEYSMEGLKGSRLNGTSFLGHEFNLVCAPPTRLLYSRQMGEILRSLVKKE